MTLNVVDNQITLLRQRCGYSDKPDVLVDKLNEEVKELAVAVLLRFPKADVASEVGDVLTVLIAMLRTQGLTLADAAQAAVDKLTARVQP